MVFALKDQWLWDSWYAKNGDVWHGYFLQADKSIGNPEDRHLNKRLLEVAFNPEASQVSEIELQLER